MLKNLSEQFASAQRAEDAARKAAAQPDGSLLRQDFLEIGETLALALAEY